MAPCGVIFRENVYFPFFVQTCQVNIDFDKTHKLYVSTVIGTCLSVNYFHNTVFGDQRIHTKIQMVNSIQVNACIR